MRWAALAASLLCVMAFGAEAPPLGINLDQFDAQKKRVLLPNGEHLAYIDMGDPKGPPVVLIHGYTDNARDWVPLIPFLNKHDRLIVVDIRGHGQSDKPECCYAKIDFAYDIKLLLDALHIRKADIVGHSLGSMITQVLAEQWPERVRKVILISSTGRVLRLTATARDRSHKPGASSYFKLLPGSTLSTLMNSERTKV